jgi:hypothetical protein
MHVQYGHLLRLARLQALQSGGAPLHQLRVQPAALDLLREFFPPKGGRKGRTVQLTAATMDGQDVPEGRRHASQQATRPSGGGQTVRVHFNRSRELE